MSARAGALTILKTCMGLRQGEGFLVAFDSGHRDQAQRLEAAAEGLGAKPTVMEVVGNTREPSTEISVAMKESDVIVFCVDDRKTLLFGHSDARVEACETGGRVGFLTQGLETVPNPSELLKIHEKAKRIGDLLEGSKSLGILSGDGKYELDARLGGKVTRLSSIIVERGCWGAVPDYAEAAVAPLESGSVGEVSIDGTIVGMGRVPSPIVLEFALGRLTAAINGEFARRVLEKARTDSGASVLCEIGFGANHLRKEPRGEFDDKKILGSIHIGLGDNHTIGGTNRSSIHLDCLMKSARLSLDGKEVNLASV